jgi:hypothetical protein
VTGQIFQLLSIVFLGPREDAELAGKFSLAVALQMLTSKFYTNAVSP